MKKIRKIIKPIIINNEKYIIIMKGDFYTYSNSAYSFTLYKKHYFFKTFEYGNYYIKDRNENFIDLFNQFYNECKQIKSLQGKKENEIKELIEWDDYNE